MIKYQARITAIGPLVGEFTQAGIWVLFGAGAPEEVAEFALLHDGQALNSPVAAGDQLWLDEQSFRILAVGEVANANLASLGHLVLKFNDQTSAELPGDVCVEARPLPEPRLGLTVKIEG